MFYTSFQTSPEPVAGPSGLQKQGKAKPTAKGEKPKPKRFKKGQKASYMQSTENLQLTLRSLSIDTDFPFNVPINLISEDC